MDENGGGRLDRIERTLEKLAAEHEEMWQWHQQFQQDIQVLLRAQAVFQEELEKLGHRVDRLTAHDELQDRQIQALNDRVDLLVSAIGEWLRSGK
jgi:septal ring factor EnvC (AmiA/AmiB activator)